MENLTHKLGLAGIIAIATLIALHAKESETNDDFRVHRDSMMIQSQPDIKEFLPKLAKIFTNAKLQAGKQRGASLTTIDQITQLSDAYIAVMHPHVNYNCFVQKIIIPPASKVCVIGDIHGSFRSLRRLTERLQDMDFLDKDLKVGDGFYIVFLGDYVDRGSQSIDSLMFALTLKMFNFDNVFLLRGNHETAAAAFEYGLWQEINENYGEKFCDYVWKKVTDLFNWLPVGLYIGSGKSKQYQDLSWILCCHGGLEPAFDPSLFLHLPAASFYSLKTSLTIFQIPPTKTGFMWSDFIDDEPTMAICRPSVRGAGVETNELATKHFLKKWGIQAIIRGHQHCDYGCKIGGFQHWLTYNNGALAKEAGELRDGFALCQSSYPVFTFSTAIEVEDADLTSDCFGILTTAEVYKNWRLMPYEFKLQPSPEPEPIVDNTLLEVMVL